MRKIWLASVVALAIALAAGTAGATSVSVGAFGGLSFPVLNDQAERGTLYGVRVPVNLLPLLTVEPYYAQSALGDLEEEFGGLAFTRDGGDLTSFGANVLLSFGGPIRFYPFGGIGQFKIEREGSESLEEMGYSFGLGLGIGLPAVPGLSIDVRGEMTMIPTDETSQKFANATLGATWRFFSVP
ncbi:MAG: hypothetical protein HOP12_09965 [Candidatus Eisenbacteria bacterium]|uniref:Outer membrane protein beta-barrel domain-containing protein n=1 Tax=Eiseniibacteriota bacterium TaxID=2212470 RepID=A0A849SGI5_UNCEI|nr:hypothetical protein [Candidatus Eisenbacteria bacterium]